ncbi:Bifunctional dethiobiotin synthetase/7 [Raphanus sativus]|uniref:Bifunctional dethiobiotin synthetase/7,8-diamino-pelargonic acid aminotransferase, mitochondrial n=1 Tax=Raphanus sativus TaxID=3726 RepID=A0A6J0LEV1_RAPSA|nr:bifunctional dethiobiotin synthetase/7,8-diamino-pelargonic acid aminotransferase, mitochondrial [Raphanus sativus]KAJ4875285.1 Bifunctional dethiobiotin synthetase/7 [Raphanus sativus]
MFPVTATLLRNRLHHLRHHIRFNSTSAPPHFNLPLNHPTYLIWSANTSLGKTLVSTGIAASFLLQPPPSHSPNLLYLKPIQTGFPTDSDSRFLFSKLHSLSLLRRTPLSLSNSVLRSSLSVAQSLRRNPHRVSESGICDLNFSEEKKTVTACAAPELICKTLYAWEAAISPHLAAEREHATVKDSVLLKMLEQEMECGRSQTNVLCLVETAGGVASPGPSGTLQCDLYRPFRLPGILVGDGRLGGISGTIAAYESLKLRGYDVAAVVFEDHGLVNEVPLTSYLRNKVPVLVLPPVPKDPSDDLIEWFVESDGVFKALKEVMVSVYLERVERLNGMAKQAGEVFWWPFTQHKLVAEETVTVIDSRCGENFSVYKASDNNSITQQFDACASWWTQGPDPAFQAELAREMGYTAARFGHVMFPENVYEPALKCAELLLDGVGKGWASRVYFSDNGSTAIEIALKMAFRKFCVDHETLLGFSDAAEEKKHIVVKVLALRGSYHGDTLGAMEAQAPSPYTGFLQQPWYTGRGLFLDPPTVSLSNGAWNLSLPESFSQTASEESGRFTTRDEIFDKSRDTSALATVYSAYVSEQLQEYSGISQSAHVGALIIEPVIHGAGGMHMVDPLFQRVLVNECRNRKIPVIFDEVFTGFWRLGVETTADLLGCKPDIACFAKLMTGGMIPLAVTLATDAVFDSFSGDSKLKALLHGHSYSAHAMGCATAAKAIEWFKDPETNHNIVSQGGILRELWDEELVQQISCHAAVQRVVVLGTLFALELKVDASNSGYASLYAKSLLEMLREDGLYMRPLGNVVYLMCGPCTSPEICRRLLTKLHKRLGEFSRA